MAVRQIAPYLYFYGRAKEAIEFYQSALGAKVETTLTWDQLSKGDATPANKGRVAHAALRIDGQLVMLSDARSEDKPLANGNVHVSLDFDNNEDLIARLDALTEQSGKPKAPVHDTFWGGKIAMQQDKFGINWIFVTSEEKK